MDTLSIKKYHRHALVVDKKINSLKRLSKADNLPIGNISLTKSGSIKTDIEFLEFYINDTLLTELLNSFYNQKGSILDNWVGVLGWTTNLPAEIIKIKQLLGKNISDKEIRQVFPASWTDIEFKYYLDKYRDELANPEIIIYCCAECGDYDCGGIAVSIDKTDNSVIWKIIDKEKMLSFQFDKYQYFDILNNRLNYLQKQA